jgi:hypothetical protein
VKLNAKCWTRVLVRKPGAEAANFNLVVPHLPVIPPVTALLISPDVTTMQWVGFLEKAKIQQLPLQLYFFGTCRIFLFDHISFLTLHCYLLAPKEIHDEKRYHKIVSRWASHGGE